MTPDFDTLEELEEHLRTVHQSNASTLAQVDARWEDGKHDCPLCDKG